MKIFSALQIRLWDQQTIKNEPITSVNLMERASMECFLSLISKFTYKQSYYIFCGTGNNGGDGLAITRLLFNSRKNVTVFILDSTNKSDDFNTNLQRIISLNIQPHYIHQENDFPMINEDAIIIDALFGTGLNRPLDGIAQKLVSHINELNKTVVSIDIPSGLFADSSSTGNTVIQSNYTLSFQTNKLAFLLPENEKFIGETEILDIGLDKQFYIETKTAFTTIDKELIDSIYKPRNQHTHKYDYGHALLFAGSQNMLGAGILTATACLRTGAGLVTIKTDADKQMAFQIAIPEAITSIENDFKIISNKKNVIGFGPGLEINSFNQQLLSEIITTRNSALVIDASGLQMLAECKDLLKNNKRADCILTPHAGEFEKLFGKSKNDFERLELAIQQSAKLNVTIVLKGHHTAIICPDGEVFFNLTGNAGMATAGSGDVFTGMITGLLAQGYNEKHAAILGVYLHGLSGDFAAQKLSEESMIASDIIQNIGKAFLAIYPNKKAN